MNIKMLPRSGIADTEIQFSVICPELNVIGVYRKFVIDGGNRIGVSGRGTVSYQQLSFFGILQDVSQLDEGDKRKINFGIPASISSRSAFKRSRDSRVG